MFDVDCGDVFFLSACQTEIEKLANDYLGLFHFPPLVKVGCFSLPLSAETCTDRLNDVLFTNVCDLPS